MKASTCHNMTLGTDTFQLFVSAVTSKKKLFETVFNSFHFLIIATKNSILDVAGVLGATLIADIFVLLHLNQFEVNFGFIQKSVNQFEWQRRWLVAIRWEYADFKQLEKTAVHSMFVWLGINFIMHSCKNESIKYFFSIKYKCRTGGQQNKQASISAFQSISLQLLPIFAI